MDLSLLGAIQIDGGDSSAVQDQLRNVQQVHATRRAFAAILADGFVVTWGNPDGGDICRAISAQECAAGWAFADLGR